MVDAKVVKQSVKHPRPWRGIGVFIMGAIFAVGLISIASYGARLLPHKAAPKPKTGTSAVSNAVSDVATIDGATFSYLVPGKSADWSVLGTGQAFDKAKGVAKYTIVLNNNNVHVTMSQQAMPVALMPRGSVAFSNFINGSKVSRSQDVGDGTLYYLPALYNGAPANGTDTVIYATDSVLLFGRAESIIGYDAWAKLVGSLSPHS